MATPHDYRSDKMESREGLGLALERRRRWEESLPADVRRAAFGAFDGQSIDQVLGVERAAAFRKAIQQEAKERADLIGFWVAWHCAGGFEALEGGGWNRATLFRKVKRFRTVFGAHPDEYSFDFLTVDPAALWWDDLAEMLGGPESPKE